MRLALIWTAVLGAACSFDGSGVVGGDDDVVAIDGGEPIDGEGPPIDSDPGAPCVEGCDGDEMVTCPGGPDGEPDETPCDLGCSEEGTLRCLAVRPSNDVSRGELDDVTAGLSAAAGHVLVIDAGNGGVWDYDVTLETLTAVRAADVVGIDAGMRYSQQGGMGVLSIDSLSVSSGGGLLVSGFVPLVILSRGAVDIAGWADASAGCSYGTYLRWCAGPGGGWGGTGTGANLADGCGPGANGYYGAGDDSGGGGGAGAQAGAASGATNAGQQGAGGVATACADADLQPLIGGAGGGAAQLTDPGDAWADGGAGGGAVQITSLASITVHGEIYAVGEGGEVSVGNNGGGGGGAGGSILLEAPAIDLAGGAVWLGGGGGGGGRPPGGTPPDAPANGNGLAGQGALQAASGGNGSGGTGADGRGGAGGIAGSAPTSGDGGQDGTGGGGGGAGRLRVNVIELSDDLFETSGVRSDGTLGLE